MQTVTSISGGKTSAYLAANYKSHELVFALVRTNDGKCRFPDAINRQRVSDRLGVDFVGTLEEDSIIYTIFDLEQYLGRKIHWVTGETYDELLDSGYLPNVKARFCTTELKIRPIFHWWAAYFNMQPVKMNIGFRLGEGRRVKRTLQKTNKDGFSEFKATFKKNKKGQNKWETVAWRKPEFPLYFDMIDKADINRFWEDKPVRFAGRNNCVGCFHRSAVILNQVAKQQPTKFDWFVRQEQKHKGFWRKDIKYAKVKKMRFTESVFDCDINEKGCDSGYCGV